MTWLVDAGALAKTWLSMLGMVAAQGTVLALIALAITRAARLRPAWQAAIWLVVALKFALPWGPAMPWSLSDLIASWSASEVTAGPIEVPVTLARTAAAHPLAWPAIGWLVLAGLWLVGAAIVTVRAVLAQRATSRAARDAFTTSPAPVWAAQLVATLAERMRVRAPRLAIGRDDIGPHVVGVIRPIIVVPRALLGDPALLRAALLHELAHVRRRDALARFVQIAGRALMWWWPVVAIAHRRLEIAREAACDAWALEAGDVPRHAYARLLVRMAELHTTAAPALAARLALDTRVAAVLGPPARARMTHVHRLALAGWAVLALGGARSPAAAPRPEVCIYTPQMAEALFLAFPQADLDGDGSLSRDEACDLQAELRRIPDEERTSRLSPEAEAQLATMLPEPLCCNCGGVEVYSSPETASCQKVEGVER